MGFTKAELKSYEGASVPDLVGPGLKLLFVGINPGLWTAATQTHFAHPGNRFYPALRLAGIVDREISRADGMTDDDRAYLISRGIGNTNLVTRATVRADELIGQLELMDRGRYAGPVGWLDASGDGLFVEANPTGSLTGLAGRLTINAAVDPSAGGAVWRLRAAALPARRPPARPKARLRPARRVRPSKTCRSSSARSWRPATVN